MFLNKKKRKKELLHLNQQWSGTVGKKYGKLHTFGGIMSSSICLKKQ